MTTLIPEFNDTIANRGAITKVPGLHLTHPVENAHLRHLVAQT
jgi:hypothetical protein